MKLIHLAHGDFIRLADKTDLGEDARAMAKGVLVDGRSMPNVAEEFKVTKQRVHIAVESIRKEHTRSGHDCNGWVRVEMDLPQGLAVELNHLAEKLRREPDDSVRQGALVKLLRALASVENTLG